MRLLTKLKRIERDRAEAQRAEEAADRERMPTGVIWTDAEQSLPEDQEIPPGMDVVRDFTILSHHQGATDAKTRERLTIDADDRGDIFNTAGEKIGQVIEDDGHIVCLDYDETKLTPAEAAPPATQGAA